MTVMTRVVCQLPPDLDLNDSACEQCHTWHSSSSLCLNKKHCMLHAQHKYACTADLFSSLRFAGFKQSINQSISLVQLVVLFITISLVELNLMKSYLHIYCVNKKHCMLLAQHMHAHHISLVQLVVLFLSLVELNLTKSYLYIIYCWK